MLCALAKRVIANRDIDQALRASLVRLLNKAPAHYQQLVEQGGQIEAKSPAKSSANRYQSDCEPELRKRNQTRCISSN